MKYLFEINEDSIYYLSRYKNSGSIDLDEGSAIYDTEKNEVIYISEEEVFPVNTTEFGERISEDFHSELIRVDDFVDSGHTKKENRALMIVEKIKQIAGDSYEIEEVEPYGPRTQSVYIDNVNMKVYVRFPGICDDDKMQEIFGPLVRKINLEQLSEYHLAKRLIWEERVFILYRDYVNWFKDGRSHRQYYDVFKLKDLDLYNTLIRERQNWPKTTTNSKDGVEHPQRE